MALSANVKTSLDETRTLMLGAQILLGFQFNGAFQPRFDSLPNPAKIAVAGALGLMLASVGLLIAPSAFHRIADRGESTGRTKMITGRLAAAALLPFAVALGIDIGIAATKGLGDTRSGALAGAAFTLIGLLAWFGWGWIMQNHAGHHERRKAESERGARETAPLHSRIEQMLTEARVILPGAQALLGFQLAIVLTDSFEKLTTFTRNLHTAALLCVALSVALLITPAAIHRIVWAGEDSEDMLRSGGRITMLALLPLAFGTAADCYVVLTRMLSSTIAAAFGSTIVLCCLLSLWIGWPFVERQQRKTGFAEQAAHMQHPFGD